MTLTGYQHKNEITSLMAVGRFWVEGKRRGDGWGGGNGSRGEKRKDNGKRGTSGGRKHWERDRPVSEGGTHAGAAWLT